MKAVSVDLQSLSRVGKAQLYTLGTLEDLRRKTSFIECDGGPWLSDRGIEAFEILKADNYQPTDDELTYAVQLFAKSPPVGFWKRVKWLFTGKK